MTFLAVSLAWLPFRAGNLAQAGQMALALLSPWRLALAWQQSGLTPAAVAHLLTLLPVSFLAGRWAYEKKPDVSIRDLTITALLLLIIAFCWLQHLRDGTPNAFIYFQF